MRGLVLVALVSAGCAGARASKAPDAPQAEDPDISIKRPEKPEPTVDDPNAEHITMDGEEANTGPTDIVTSPPERPKMPSMLPSVLTGPNGAAPMTASDD